MREGDNASTRPPGYRAPENGFQRVAISRMRQFQCISGTFPKAANPLSQKKYHKVNNAIYKILLHRDSNPRAGALSTQDQDAPPRDGRRAHLEHMASRSVLAVVIGRKKQVGRGGGDQPPRAGQATALPHSSKSLFRKERGGTDEKPVVKHQNWATERALGEEHWTSFSF